MFSNCLCYFDEVTSNDAFPKNCKRQTNSFMALASKVMIYAIENDSLVVLGFDEKFKILLIAIVLKRRNCFAAMIYTRKWL